MADSAIALCVGVRGPARARDRHGRHAPATRACAARARPALRTPAGTSLRLEYRRSLPGDSGDDVRRIRDPIFHDGSGDRIIVVRDAGVRRSA